MNRTVVAVIAGAAVASPALAGFSGTMFESATDPASWAGNALIASLDSSAFDYVNNSGFEAVIGGPPDIVLDRTSVRTDVYRVGLPTVIVNGMNSITLLPGHLVFAYRLRLVGLFPGLSVETLNEAQVIGAPDFGFGVDVMARSLINGQGFVTTGHGNNPAGGNIDGDDDFGTSVDFEWPSADVDHLDNGNFITMLMFTEPAGIGEGVLNMSAPPGQSGGLTGVAQANEAPPVLIPIIPTPGAALVGLIGVAAIAVPRRRNR